MTVCLDKISENYVSGEENTLRKFWFIFVSGLRSLLARKIA